MSLRRHVGGAPAPVKYAIRHARPDTATVEWRRGLAYADTPTTKADDPKMTATIALVDDDRNILTSVSIALQTEGFVTRRLFGRRDGVEGADRQPAPTLQCSTSRCRGWTDWNCCVGLREKSQIPVIFLTSKDDELDEALGLAMGADDYIAKPFSQRAADRPHPRDPAAYRADAIAGYRNRGGSRRAARSRAAEHGSGATSHPMGRRTG